MPGDELSLESESEVVEQAEPINPTRRDKFHVDTRSGVDRRVNEERRGELRFEKNRRSGKDRRAKGSEVWSDNCLD